MINHSRHDIKPEGHRKPKHASRQRDQSEDDKAYQDMVDEIYDERHDSQRKKNAATVVGIIMALVFGTMVGGSGMRIWNMTHPTVKTITNTVKQSFPSDDEHMRTLVKELKSQDGDMNDITISAVAGNAWGESKADPTALEQTSDTPSYTSSDNDIKTWAQAGHGIGIMQWTGDRAVSLMKYADAQHGSWKTLHIQVGYLLHEMNDTANWRTPTDDKGTVSADGTQGKEQFDNAVDVKSSNNAFLLGFVRPKDPAKSRSERLTAALSIYTYMQTNNL